MMDFSTALQVAKRGGKISRPWMYIKQYWHVVDGELVDQDGMLVGASYCIAPEIMAMDWEEVYG